MNPPTWYSTPERIAALEAAALAWVGTPFMENSATPGAGGGVACHRLAIAMYQATGCPCLPANFIPPRGSVRGMRGTAARTIIDFVDVQLAGRFANVSAPDSDLSTLNSQLSTQTLPGDLIALEHNGLLKHLGVVLSGRRFIHVLQTIGARISLLNDPTYGDRIAEIRRPLP